MKKYNMQIAITLLFSLLIIAKLNAQQVPQFTQLLQNRHMLNPAASGEFEDNYVLAGYRKQWAGMDLSPTTYYIGYNRGFVKTIEPEHQPLAIRTARVDEYHSEQFEGGTSAFKHGVGAYMISDNYGAFQNMSLNLNYALHTYLKDDLMGSIGINTRFHNSKFDARLAQVENTGDATYDAFVLERNNLTSLEIDFGAYLYSSNWFAGYSTNQLTGDAIAFSELTNKTFEIHHTFIGGYDFEINEKIDFTPSTIIKAVGGAPLSIDLIGNLELNEKFDIGLGYRTQDALLILVGTKVDNKYRIGYSYDLTLSGLSTHNSGSHEITLGVKF